MDASTFDYKPFRDNLRALITGRGLSLNALSEEIGMRTATLSRYLSDDRKPDLIYAVAISRYFNVSLDWLLGLNGEKFEVLPEEVQKIATAYQVATLDDRRVVQAVLNKYERT